MTLVAAPGVWLATDDGGRCRLETDRWFDPPDATEQALLDRATGPVLDLGCGPGRLVAELRRRGVVALGVDTSAVALRRCRDQGLPVLGRCLFDRLPREGDWRSVLLLDGNLGIGGAPDLVLARVADLLRPGGRLLAELSDPAAATGPLRARLETEGGNGAWFDWALVGPEELDAALDPRLSVVEHWSGDGRRFVEVERTDGGPQ